VYEVLITAGRPLVTLKAAVSLDGRLAARTGDARWISSEESRVRAHRLRARHEVVLIGAGTARADDPALDVRHVRGRNPAVAVLDTRLTLSPRAAMLGLQRGAPVIVYCGRRAPAARARRLRAAGAEVVRVAQHRGRLRLAPVLADLLQRGCWRVLVEGGGAVIGALLAERLADRMELAQAPLLLGAEAPPLALWAGPARVAEAPRLEAVRRRRSGPDSFLSGRLVWPAG
jgi:diaminohydroxyphosphoribosylaminopyrimidine deaminase/5-amino-6-(5-phosphoribosylamino)uracil reductase